VGSRACVPSRETGPCIDSEFTLNYTMQKEVSRHIKMSAHIWSIKCR
jgi:hypothetical protein